jgi:nitrate reductase NapE
MADNSNNTKFGALPKFVPSRRSELIVFLIIVALVWPVVTVGIVGGYGFAVWMYQIVAGPPGPPHRGH